MAMDKVIAITGANGFVGQNVAVRLAEVGYNDIRKITRQTSNADFKAAIADADVVIHLAGANRPKTSTEFMEINRDFTQKLISEIANAGTSPTLIYASSTKATESNEYGYSKKAAEDVLLKFAKSTQSKVSIFRLPNIFGKWCRPNYNSAVATFCYNVARRADIVINDPTTVLELIYIDDLIDQWLHLINSPPIDSGFILPENVYSTSVGDVAESIRGFASDRDDQMIASVGTGLERALYATYVAALPPAEFSYTIPAHSDPRGSFSEMLKTRTSGQFSYFTAFPGVTRGGHYHHTKTEKFLIVCGEALFRFRQIITGEVHEVRTSADAPTVVETIPGWAHDVTNVGEGVMVSLLWANEIFDRERPDTIAAKV